jgi:hypothetical protein
MDSKLLQKLGAALEKAEGSGLKLTPRAVMLLTVIIDSIEDNLAQRVDLTKVISQKGSLYNVQVEAIDKIPTRFVEVLSEKYPNPKTVDGLMVLTVMPQLLSDFCPPFS